MIFMEEKKCPACGAALEFEREVSLDGLVLELHLCPDCGRAELCLPQKALEVREEEASGRTWLREFQEKVKAGEMTAAPFLCPTCGNLRRDRVCPVCGSVMDLGTMEELESGDLEEK